MMPFLRWRRALADRALRGNPNAVTLVAIVRNEGPYLVEWLAHHLAIGFDRIVVYDNESTDDTRALFKALVRRDLRLRRVPWPSPPDASAQIMAYVHALSDLATSWVMYLDPDEFVVPLGHSTMAGLIETLPDAVSSLHVNRRHFGVSGREDPSCALVTRAFTRSAPYASDDHYHFRTLVRADRIAAVRHQDVICRHGRRILSDGLIFSETSETTADRVVFEGVQINRYPNRALSQVRECDRYGTENRAVRAFDAPFAAEYRRLCAILDRKPTLSG
ncbi:glycosyltransferase family 2 protein [Methylobacterium sp. B4]|uniref:glycosyltransferase family 2 protein n=1 Tax=Methylobacterium sp. B4 TaxID=1938755 RepID=UPI000D75AEDB|nr:glycosyltransferase family 2 protein [Methylobacterium sp. B4]PXW66792.1 glycosyl transferase family 2 [Methylobacterium sp. B4]